MANANCIQRRGAAQGARWCTFRCHDRAERVRHRSVPGAVAWRRPRTRPAGCMCQSNRGTCFWTQPEVPGKPCMHARSMAQAASCCTPFCACSWRSNPYAPATRRRRRRAAVRAAHHCVPRSLLLPRLAVAHTAEPDAGSGARGVHGRARPRGGWGGVRRQGGFAKRRPTTCRQRCR